MNDLYGPKNIERQRSSGYKSTTHAIAEIVDNSLDAGATEINIVFREEEINLNNATAKRLTEIIFIDNGSGMDGDLMNSCLTFAQGAGRSEGRIGAFGYGLPNSTIATCRRGDVYSLSPDDGIWRNVYLDIDEVIESGTSRYPEASPIEKIPGVPKSLIPDSGTIVKWTKLDKCDAARADTMLKRCNELLGRLYRYWLNEEKVRISISIYDFGNKSPRKKLVIQPNDPMFLAKSKTPISKEVWAMSNNSDGKYRNQKLLHLTADKWDPAWHLKQFVINHDESNGTHEPLFMRAYPHHDNLHKIKLGRKEFAFRILASHATKPIRNPGVRNGGSLPVGRAIGQKMTGTNVFKGGNIYWIREGRELDSGDFKLYTTTEEKERYWTIEIHFDHELDDLLGVSNTKQSVNFKKWSGGEDVERPDNRADLSEAEMRELLFYYITRACQDAIRDMKKTLDGYVKEFTIDLKKAMSSGDGEKAPVPTLEGTVLKYIPRSDTEWSKKQKQSITQYLKNNYPSVSKKDIENQVDNAAKGLTETIVLYAPSQTGDLFSLESAGEGKHLTVFNTQHPFYEKVILPLKGENKLKIFTIVIEMLLSSFALEQRRLTQDYPDYSESLEIFVQKASTQLNLFVRRAGIEIDANELKKLLKDD